MLTEEIVLSLAAGNMRWERKNVPMNIWILRKINTVPIFLIPRDMCMIEHIPELVKAGVSSIKIERPGKISLLRCCYDQCVPPCN